MGEVICVSDNGSLLSESFDSVGAAQSYIDEHDEEDQYLMNHHKMDEVEFHAKLILSHLFAASDAQHIDKSIQDEDNPSEIYKQITLITSDSWVFKMYANYVKCFFIDGPDDIENDWKFTGFSEYLSQLRKDIDFAEDYDAALIKHNNGGDDV